MVPFINSYTHMYVHTEVGYYIQSTFIEMHSDKYGYQVTISHLSPYTLIPDTSC